MAVKRNVIISGKVDPERAIHSDGWRGYGGLVDVGFDKHYRVQHGQDEFANSASDINGFMSFWSFAKRRLTQFNLLVISSRISGFMETCSEIHFGDRFSLFPKLS